MISRSQFPSLGLGLALLFVSGGASQATTWLISNGSTGKCTVSDPHCSSLSRANNAAANGDTLKIAAGTYSIQEIQILKNLTIQGEGAQQTILRAQGENRLFSIPSSGSTVAFIDLAITHGYLYSDFGAGIDNHGKLSLLRCDLNHNEGVEGGAIASHEDSVLSIIECSLTDNSTATLGGAIFDYGKLTVSKSTFARNRAFYAAGAILLSYHDMVITDSTFSENQADEAGAIYNNGQSVDLRHCSFVNNLSNAGNIVSAQLGTVQFQDTLLYNSNPIQSNCFGEWLVSLGHNLDNNGSCGFAGPGDLSGNALTPLDANVGPLQDNGGPTFTHALLAHSPAIDSGHSPDAALTDQRGAYRGADGDGNGTFTSDIGAYEAPNLEGPYNFTFDFHIPGFINTQMTLIQGSPPFLSFQVVGGGGYIRKDITPIKTLAGCGIILSVKIIGSTVIVTATKGVYQSRDGFIYSKVG